MRVVREFAENSFSRIWQQTSRCQAPKSDHAHTTELTPRVGQAYALMSIRHPGMSPPRWKGRRRPSSDQCQHLAPWPETKIDHVRIIPYQLLGIDTGSKIAFEVRGGEIVVSRVETTHEDPAIGAFLGLLEAEIRSGRNLTTLPEDLAQAMLANANHSLNLDEDIDGEVAI